MSATGARLTTLGACGAAAGLLLVVRVIGRGLGLAAGAFALAARDPGPLRSFDPVEVGHLESTVWVAYYRRQWLRLLVLSLALTHKAFRMDWGRTLHGAWLVLRANQLWAPYPANDPDGARRCMRRFYALLRLAHGGPADPGRAAALEVEWWAVHREHQRGATPPPAAVRDSAAGNGSAAVGGPAAGDEPVAGRAAGDRPAAGRAAGGGSAARSGSGAGVGPVATDSPLVTALARLYAYLYSVDEDSVRPAAALRAEAMDLSDEWVAQGCPPHSSLIAAERATLVRSYASLLAAVHR